MDDPRLLFSPFPTIHSDGTLLDGLLMKQSGYCLGKCSGRECAIFPPPHMAFQPKLYTCQRGYTVVVASLNDMIVRINGVIEVSSNKAPAAFRRRNRDRKLKLPECEAWLSAMSKAQEGYRRAIDVKAKEAIHALHDIKSLIGSILRTSEEWVCEQTGASVDEQFENSPERLRRIYQSCRVLESLLLVTDILANPEVAKYGKPRRTSIHAVLYLLSKIHEDKAQSQRKSIRLVGRSTNSVRLYSSFIVVPHVLIDNAIKHSDPNELIRLSVHDHSDAKVSVDICSYGLLVPEGEEESIFSRGVRGSNAEAKGSGLGLYIAQTVAKANAFIIHYRPTNRGLLGQKGENHFLFTVPASAPE
jgi:hypothetical protein